MRLSGLDFQHARQKMIQGQLHPQGVTHPKILSVFEKVPREFFLATRYQTYAYTDQDLCIEPNALPKRYVLSPRKLARLLSAVHFDHFPKVLVLGFATGYSLALCYELGAKVYGVEENSLFFSFAQAALQRYFDFFYEKTNYEDLLFIEQKTLKDGLFDYGAYDYILIEGGVSFIPEELLQQLRPEGQLLGIHLAPPLGIFSCSKTGDIHHLYYEGAFPLKGFEPQKRFFL